MKYQINPKEDFLSWTHGQIIDESDIPEPWKEHVPRWVSQGFLIPYKEKAEKLGVKPNFDFNKDGKVDKKDVRLAAKLMGKASRRGRPKKRGR